MQFIGRWLLLAFTALPASAVCATAQAATDRTPAVSAAPAMAGADGAPQNYRLGPSDRVTISVYGEDDLSREYTISPGGMVSLPLIGDVAAKGRTADDLRDEIQHRLANGFLNNPTVTVMISGFRNFYILGEVNKPGAYPYESGLTVTQAVAEAAGFTYRAAKRYVFVKHEGESKETRMVISPDMLVSPGDTIRLGERYF
jgi:protein involved in polysaccharide export with SLBB domain